MDSVNKNSNNTSHTQLNEESNTAMIPGKANKFDLSIIGKIDLDEAEKIASEEVLFLTEADLIDGLEEFELVPVKNFKQTDNIPEIKIDDEKKIISEVENLNDADELLTLPTDESVKEQLSENLSYVEADNQESVIVNNFENDLISDTTREELMQIDSLPEEINFIEPRDDIDLIVEVTPVIEIENSNITQSRADEYYEDLTITKKLFTIKINEETLDAQLSSILDSDFSYKFDDRLTDKYNSSFNKLKCKFADDQYSNRPLVEDNVSYNEDPLTERLVKMIEVADGKMQLLEAAMEESDFFHYILEDYTLYNAEKFDNVFKEEVFYSDSDFEFIDNAIIRDDFTKYIHEIDDYFESEESLIQSEISEILGLIPEENVYIEDKLFGEYYKKVDLDNEIDFIKPEIDFFRINYTGAKNLNYIIEANQILSDAEKISIEEDISSSNAIVFEESITEIEDILMRDFGLTVVGENLNINKNVIVEEILDITDKIIILEDKDKLSELVSEFPDKHDNLIKLLSYLDGLFEKLPEEVIRKFAESEYFELYSKVLKEIGV